MSGESDILNCEPDNLFKEIEAGEAARSATDKHYANIMQDYAGGSAGTQSMVFEYASQMVPKIVSQNPDITVYSRRNTSKLILDQAKALVAQKAMVGQIDPMQAEAAIASLMKHTHDATILSGVIRRWVEQEEYVQLLDPVCYDFLSARGTIYTTMGAHRDNPKLRWPKSQRIAPERYIRDPLAQWPDEPAWEGHWFTIPKPALKRMAEEDADGLRGWNKKAIEDLTTTADDKHSIDRQEVKVYQIWVPSYTDSAWSVDPREFAGSIHVLATSKDSHSTTGIRGVEIRKPRPAYCPWWGPYAKFGAYVVPGSSYLSSPLALTFRDQKELQKHVIAMNTNARKYKRLALASNKNPALIQQLKNAPDMLVIGVDDETFDKNKVAVIEIGGISEQQMEHYAFFKSALDRALGRDDAQRGKVDSEATATAVAVADESVATRVSYLLSNFARGVRWDIRTKAWYMVMDERFQCYLDSEVAEAMGLVDPLFRGGVIDGDEFNFDDFGFGVDVNSLGHTSEQLYQRRVIEFVNLQLQMVPLMSQFPYVNWRKELAMIGQALNLPEAENMVDFDQLRHFTQMQAMQERQAMVMSAGQATKPPASGGSSKPGGGAGARGSGRPGWHRTGAGFAAKQKGGMRR